MSTDLTTQTKEPDIPSPLQVKIDETIKFVKKYQVPIAFSVGSVVTYVAVRDIHQLYIKRDIVNAVIESIDNTLDDENELALLTMTEFIEDKGLLLEYRDFFEKMNS